MSKPEIDRRCQACGASFRETASFCPQCGEGLAPTSSVVTAPLDDLAPGEDDASPKPAPRESEGSKLEPATSTTAPLGTPDAKAPAGKVRDKIQRATTLARDVEGDVIHRVQKVRQISSVVLDEAGYDPSLRFVLVAAALFLLFLLVLALNKVIG